jgi:hypothetical protein
MGRLCGPSEERRSNRTPHSRSRIAELRPVFQVGKEPVRKATTEEDLSR